MKIDSLSPTAIAARIRSLIAREDRGDPIAAAHRLGVPLRDLLELERALADDASSAKLDLLAAVAIRYRADACWLLTGSECSPSSKLPAEARLRISELLLEIGDRLVQQYRARRMRDRTAGTGPFAGIPPSADDPPLKRAMA